MVLASFSPYLCSGTLISLVIRVKDFANSNSRFSHLFHPGEPFTPMIAYFTRRSRRYPPINSRDRMCRSPLQFPATDNSICITIYAFRSSIQTEWLVLLQDTPKFPPLFRDPLSFIPSNTSSKEDTYE